MSDIVEEALRIIAGKKDKPYDKMLRRENSAAAVITVRIDYGTLSIFDRLAPQLLLTRGELMRYIISAVALSLVENGEVALPNDLIEYARETVEYLREKMSARRGGK